MPRSDERLEFLEDIVTCAVEAGYEWFQVGFYQYMLDDELRLCYGREKDIFNRTYAQVYEMSDEYDGTYKDEMLIWDADAAAKGLNALINGTIKCNESMRTALAEASAANDAGDIDAEMADCIQQAALLGDIIYG